jgi:Ca2+-binding RTX toxin-like protein
MAGTAFVSGAGVTTAGDADDRIIYDTTTGNLYYDADGVGGAVAVQFAWITTIPAGLDASDFEII